MIYKNRDIETNINERNVNLGNIDVTLYTNDRQTASLRLVLKKEVRYGSRVESMPIDLTKTTLIPKIDLVMEDGSIFANESLEEINPENGVVQYNIPENVVKHVGRVEASVKLIDANMKNISVQVAFFYFVIASDGLTDKIGKEINSDILDTKVRKIILENEQIFKGRDADPNDVKILLEPYTKKAVSEEFEKLSASKQQDSEVVLARDGKSSLNERLNEDEYKIDNTQRVINIVARGAKGDGITDNYKIIQDAITEAEIDGSSIFIPSGTFYVSKSLKTKHMTSYNYRFGIKIFGNGKDSIITRNAGKIPADYSSHKNLPSQAAICLFGSNNIIEDISINDSQIGIYIGQDPSTTEPSSASMNRLNNIWMEYVGTGVEFIHGAGNHYNILENFHIIHSQICVDLGDGYFMDKFNNNRNTFNNFRVSRTWIGFLLRETDGNFFNNVYAETLQGDGAIGDAPSFLPKELNGKKTFIVALDGQYNTFNNYGAEAVEWYIYSVGFRNSFVNGMTKDDSVETSKVLFPNPRRQPLNYLANSSMIAGFTYQPQAGIFFEGSNGIGLQAPFRIFDIGYHRQKVSLAALSENVTNATSLSQSRTHRLSRKVEWSTHIRFTAKFADKTDQFVKDPIKIKLPFNDVPEDLYTNGLTTTYTKPFLAFVGNSNGATEMVQARISTSDEAKTYGGYHLVVNSPDYGWRTDANVNYLAFDISWNV